jgi:serine/threonine protein kinase
MRGILEAVNYCHNNKICHRDIKPDNILINDKDEIKLIDFGLSQIISGTERNLTGKKGTKTYMAPEVILNKHYNEKCDVWSIAHVFYILLAFKQPFKNNS